MYAAKKSQSTYEYFFSSCITSPRGYAISLDKIFRVPPINRIKSFLKFSLYSRGFPRSTAAASLIASGEAIAKCGSEAGFTIKTFFLRLYGAAALASLGQWTWEEEQEEVVEKKRDGKRGICPCVQGWRTTGWPLLECFVNCSDVQDALYVLRQAMQKDENDISSFDRLIAEKSILL